MMKSRVSAATMLATVFFGIPAMGQQFSAGASGAAAAGTGADGSVTAEATQAPAPAPAPYAQQYPQQQPPPPPPPADAQGEAAAAPAAEATSDHEAMVGRIAFGYLGFVNIPYGAMASENDNYPANSAAAPVIGMRLWLNSTLGMDAGLGIVTTFGTHQVPQGDGTTLSNNATAPTGLAVHFGMPIALKAARHYAFQIIPEMNIGYAQMAASDALANTGTDMTGIHLDIGARAGAEIHFGFIGIPELSLVGSIGLRADVHQTKTEARAGNVTTTIKDSRTIISTTVGHNPWDIFAGNISAFYYL